MKDYEHPETTGYSGQEACYRKAIKKDLFQIRRVPYVLVFMLGIYF